MAVFAWHQLCTLRDDVRTGGPRNPVFGSPSGGVFQKKRPRWETSPVRIGKTYIVSGDPPVPPWGCIPQPVVV